MAVSDSATEFDVLLTEKWRTVVIPAVYDAFQFGDRILNVTDMVKGDGEQVHINAAPIFVPGDVSKTAGTFTTPGRTYTGVDLDLDQWRQSSVEYTKHAWKLAQKGGFSALQAEAAASLSEDIESKILALESSVTNSVGDGSGNIGEDEILAAIQTIGQAKLNPMRNPDRFTFAFDWEQYASLKKQRVLSDAAYKGSADGGTQTTNIPNIYGIPTYMTNQVADGTDGPSSAATKQNLLFEKHAFAWAMSGQIDFETQRVSQTLNTLLIMDYVAGFKANLVARAVKLPSAS